jgi:hypothetical protein
MFALRWFDGRGHVGGSREHFHALCGDSMCQLRDIVDEVIVQHRVASVKPLRTISVHLIIGMNI